MGARADSGERLALLTGTGGAVRDAVAAELSRAGWTTRNLALGPSHAPTLEPAARRAEAVVHLGLRTPRELEEARRAELETRAAAAAAEVARAAGARRLIHVSTAAVYGLPRNLPCREGELKAPATEGARVRWEAERESWRAFRRGAPLTVLRPAVLYGPALRGGAARVLSLVALLGQRRRRLPILRRGPVAHLVHVEDLARAVAFVAGHPDDRAVIGRAFNVADDAPLPMAEHLATALAALGLEPGRVLPALPRLVAALLWLFRRAPDRAFLDPVNRRLADRWSRLLRATGTDPSLSLVPRIDRETIQGMAGDHYYDTSRLTALGWRPLHPVSTGEVAASVRALVAERLLPGTGTRHLPTW